MTTPEALTPEERAYLIESFNVSAPAHVLRDDDDNHVTKLLRIHDQQAARIAELQQYVITLDTVARVRTNELEAENARLREANPTG